MESWKKVTIVFTGILLSGVIFWLVSTPSGDTDIGVGNSEKSQVREKSFSQNQVSGAHSVNSYPQQIENNVKQVDLEQRLVSMESEMMRFRRQSRGESPESITTSEMGQNEEMIMFPEQMEMEAKVALESRIQELDSFVKQGEVDEILVNDLQQRIETAFNMVNITQEVGVKSAQCSQALCKVEFLGHPSGEMDILHTLLEQNALADVVELFSVPSQNDNDGLTIYFAPGRPLPGQPQGGDSKF